jgi:hypothetical protein
MTSKLLNPNITLKQIENIRKIAFRDVIYSMTKLEKNADWELLAGSVSEKITDSKIDFRMTNLVYVLKALSLEIMFDIPTYKLQGEITDRRSFKKFLGIKNDMEIPHSETIAEVKKVLLEKGIYDNLTGLIEGLLVENEDTKSTLYENENVEKKIKQLEQKIKSMTDSSDMSENAVINGKSDFSKEHSKELSKRLQEVNDKIDNLLKKEIGNNIPTKLTAEEDKVAQKLDNIESRLNQISGAEKTEPKVTISDDIYKKLFDSFYNQLKNVPGTELAEPEIKTEKTQNNIPETPKVTSEPTNITITTETSDKLKKIEEDIQKIYSRISEKERELINKEKELIDREKTIIITPAVEEKVKYIEKPVETAKTEVETAKEQIQEIDLKKKKKYHIFNDANLTEDYELGLRFYKNGFKTAFVNMRADKNDENSRIAVAEYFPNTFWGSVKQRSRWIAGIVFQNWKIHKWSGNFRTKYFLLRDRKALFSFFGIFLSNLVFAYFVLYMLGVVFNFKTVGPIVEKGTFLYFLMVSSLFFLTSRLVHRFALTYNWYGFKYAAFSFIRLIFDNLINLFATLRAIKVYNVNKKKIVWDATDHY